MNKALLLAFVDADVTQLETAKRTGISQTVLSKILNEHQEPTEAQKKAIAKALKRKVDEIFPTVAA